MITILTFLWRGWRPIYNAGHVNTWARMVKANFSAPHRVLCIAEDPMEITECETMPLWDFPFVDQARPQNSYRRLKLFDPSMAPVLGERILAIDLDCVIFKDLAPLITKMDFKAVKGIGAPLNGSMFMLKTGTNAHVWEKFDHVRSPDQIAHTQHNGRRISGSDQAWMSMQLPGVPTWGPEDGVFQFSRLSQSVWDPKTARIVFFAGHTKPWDLDCKIQRPQIYRHYMQFVR